VAVYIQAALPEEILEQGNTGISHDLESSGFVPSGHFNANMRKAIEKGFGAIRKEAQDKLDAMQGNISGPDTEKYFFYKAIVISCDSAIRFSKRYAALCRQHAAETDDAVRKAELLQMAETLDRIIEHPARTFREALQGVLLYQYILFMEGNYLGATIGRIDQQVGDYLERDLTEGRITPDEAQELMDIFFIKAADLYFSAPYFVTRTTGAYSNNIRLTIGGRKPDGSDATNEVTYLCLQSAARLKLHDPTLSLGIHKDSPPKLLEAGIETSKIVFGIPCIENTDLIIDALHKRGIPIEDARDYCIIGCVEIQMSGKEWANVSAPYSATWVNINNILLQAINNGINPMNGKPGGLKTGYLYEMESFEEVQAAYQKQLDFFLNWHHTFNNIMEYIGNPLVPVPMASATMDGCMESGKDMMLGGAKYNSTGQAILGVGTLVDSLSAIKYIVFEKKICTARELYDAIMANWEGYEILRQRVMSEVPHFGNGDPYADEIASWASDLFADKVDTFESLRGRHRPGIYSAGSNVPMGYKTFATANGRKSGEPVSDAASASQGCDKSGPTGVVTSITALHPGRYSNGLQFNMKFHPSSLNGEDGTEKLATFIRTFFEMGGMQVQYNIVDSETLRKAQAEPDEYRDLVVRVAGFSAYFVELYEDMQNDLISRNAIQM
jgi:formate C-acetyltransferase